MLGKEPRRDWGIAVTPIVSKSTYRGVGRCGAIVRPSLLYQGNRETGYTPFGRSLLRIVTARCLGEQEKGLGRRFCPVFGSRT